MKQQHGFSAVIVLLIVLIVSVIGFAGYYVWNTQQSKSDDTSDTSDSTSTKTEDTKDAEASTPKETDSWFKYASKGGEFRMRIADGLTFIGSDDSPSIYTRSYTTKAGTPGKVEIQISGTDNPYGLFVNYYPSATDGAPRGDKQTGFKTDSGLSVEKYYYLEKSDAEGIGLAKGDKEYTYRVQSGSGKVVTTTYDFYASETNQSELVEKMVKTVELP